MFQMIDESRATCDMFLAAATHEINTPLSVLYGFAQILDHSDTLLWTEEQKLYLDYIVEQAGRLGTITKSLGIYLHATHDRIQLHRTFCSLSAIIEEQIGIVSALFPKHHFYDMGIGATYWIVGDEERIGHALFHILHNAATYSLDYSIIRITPSEDIRTVGVSVRSAGVMESNEKVLACLPYFRGSNARPTEMTGIAGLGLGLTVAQAIVHAHGGGIAVMDAMDGHGTDVAMFFSKECDDDDTTHGRFDS